MERNEFRQKAITAFWEDFAKADPDGAAQARALVLRGAVMIAECPPEMAFQVASEFFLQIGQHHMKKFNDALGVF